MNYCERCQIVFDEDICPSCGSNKIREAQGIDFCLFATMEDIYAQMFEKLLQENGVVCVLLPIKGAALSVKQPGQESFKIYVAYQDMELSKCILNDFFRHLQ